MKERWFGIHKVIEEAGELIQVLGKLSAFPSGKHPDGNGPLVERMREEIADVRAALTYFEAMNNLEPDERRERQKVDKFKKWGLTGALDLK